VKGARVFLRNLAKIALLPFPAGLKIAPALPACASSPHSFVCRAFISNTSKTTPGWTGLPFGAMIRH
jgi:hypothetical protein